MRIFLVLPFILLIATCAHKPKPEAAPASPSAGQINLESDDDAVADLGDSTEPGTGNENAIQNFKALSLRPKADAVAILKKAGYKRTKIALADMRGAKEGDICVSQDKRKRNFAALRLKDTWRSASGRTTEKYPYRDRPKFIGCYEK